MKNYNPTANVFFGGSMLPNQIINKHLIPFTTLNAI